MRLGIILAMLLPLLAQLPATAQGIMEGMTVRGAAAGLGAGLAAGANHGRLIKRSAEAMAQGREYAIAQTKAIAKYSQWAVAYESKKQFANAETALQYVLKTIALRDGPGSTASVDVLRKLVKIEKLQNKIDDAVRYQKTVVAFVEAGKKPSVNTIVAERNHLSDLFIGKQDYVAAAPVLQQTAAMVKDPAVSPEQRSVTLHVYARVLNQLNRTVEAQAVEAAAAPVTPVSPVASTETVTEVPVDPSTVATKPVETVTPPVTTEPITTPPPVQPEVTPTP
jgi:hypothetical protein